MKGRTSGGGPEIKTRRESRVAWLTFAWKKILRIPKTLVLASLYTLTSLVFLDCKPGVPRRYRSHFIPEWTRKSIYRSYNRITHRSYHSNWLSVIQLPLVLWLPYSNLLLWQLFIQGCARGQSTHPYQSYQSRHYVLLRSDRYCASMIPTWDRNDGVFMQDDVYRFFFIGPLPRQRRDIARS